MEKDDIIAKVNTIIIEKLDLAETQITMNASFVKDLGIDSLDLFELILEVENEFQLVIPGEEAEKIVTVGNLVDHIRNQKSADNSQ